MRSNMKKSRIFRIFYKLGLVILLPVYCLVAMELFLRIFAPVAIMPRYVCATDFGIRGNEPNRQYWQKTPECRVLIRTNSKGIRADEEIPYEKPVGVKRIVVLGDSFGMGYEVDLKDTFTQKMAECLEEHGITVEIVNLSVSGHGNAEELIMLQEEGFKYNPDMVLLQWHSTDLDDNVRSNLFALEDGCLVRKAKTYLPGVEAQRVLFQFKAYRFLGENSQFYSFFREWAAGKVKKILVALHRNENEVDLPEKNRQEAADRAKEYRKGLTLTILERIQQECRQRQISFLLLDIPRVRGRAEFWSVFPRQNEILLNLNLDYYCPIQDFEEMSGAKLYSEKAHGHLTPLGCEIVGRGLAEYSVRYDLLKN